MQNLHPIPIARMAAFLPCVAPAALAAAFLLGPGAALPACACGKARTNACPVIENAKAGAARLSAETKLAAFMADHKTTARRFLRTTWRESDRVVYVEGFLPDPSLAQGVTDTTTNAVGTHWKVKTNFAFIPGLGQRPERSTYVSEAVRDFELSSRVWRSLRAPGAEGLLKRQRTHVLTLTARSGTVSLFIIQEDPNLPDRVVAAGIRPHLKDVDGLQELHLHILPSAVSSPNPAPPP